MPPRPVTTLPALTSRLDLSTLHALRARRAARERHALEKLALLRRLAERNVFHTLPETRVEQSWNEQLFARILGYRTLLSHAALPFNLLPKNAAGSNRYDDFSIGFFGAGSDRVVGTAELKGPGKNLDAPQKSGSYAGLSPVEQGFAAARAHGPGCRWLLVSNFGELRLYDLHEPTPSSGNPAPLAVADLRSLRNPDDLALLCAHFDAAALLGEFGKDNADMTAALDPDHLAHPLPAETGNCRLVLRFVHQASSLIALFRVEKALRAAIEASSEHLDGALTVQNARMIAKDGWAAAEALPAVRLAASRFGEVQLSALVPAYGPVPLPRGPQIALFTRLDVEKWIAAALAFATAAHAFYRSALPNQSLVGTISAELREIKDVALVLTTMQEPSAPTAGVCEAPEIVAGDVQAAGERAEHLAGSIAECLCELAVQFRDPRGGVGLSHATLTTYLERVLKTA